MVNRWKRVRERPSQCEIWNVAVSHQISNFVVLSFSLTQFSTMVQALVISSLSLRPTVHVRCPRARPSRRSFFVSNAADDDLSSFRSGLSQHLERSIKTKTFAASDANAAGADLIEVRGVWVARFGFSPEADSSRPVRAHHLVPCLLIDSVTRL